MARKILIPAFDFPPKWGGVSTYAWEVANEFHNRGHEVIVLTGQSEEDLPEASFEIHQKKFPSVGLLAWPVLTIHLVHYLRKNSVDHIFCPLWLPGGMAVFSALRILKKQIPYSLVVHAMEIIDSNENLKKRLRGKLKGLKKKCFEEAAQVFCVSLFSKQLLLESLKLQNENVFVVNNGVNPKNFSKPENEKTYDTLTLVTACRLMRNKGVDKMIKAMPSLVKKFPGIRYRILGDGPDRRRLEKLSEMMGMKEHIHFLGKVSQNELVKNYQEASLFVMLSRKEKHYVEGFGLVFLEAALCGTPSLGGRSGGIPDAIIENETGWLVDPYSQEAIEKKLEAILSDTKQLKKAADKALHNTLNDRTWKHSVDMILEHMSV